MYHCHTDYSIADSCTKYPEYVELAKRDGMKALSISEHGFPFNWYEKMEACKDAGIRYIHSVEIYLTEQLEPKVRDSYHTVLMARNDAGFRELNSLISLSGKEDHTYYGKNRLTFDEFLNMSDNIISTSACLASPLWQLPEDHPRYAELVNKYTFLEVQPHNHPEQIAFNKRLLKLSKQYGKPLIAGTDTHSSTPYKAECRTVWIGSKGRTYGDEDSFDLTYKTYNELVEAFAVQGALPEAEYLRAIANTNQLYDMTEDITIDTSIKYPILYGSPEADEKKLREVIRTKFADKVRRGVIPREQVEAFKTAIQEEVRVFEKLHMSGFMLSMSELVSWCKAQGMAIGTARGSVGGSRVAYVTDVIDLNPETWHTIFSRFCNENRVEIGDIDIDCVASVDRPKIFEYITGRFGEDKTARVSAFGTAQEKDTIDIIGRYYTKQWEKQGAVGRNKYSLKFMEKVKAEFDEDQEATKKRYPDIFYYFDGIYQIKTSQSMHAAGMVISPVSLDESVGTYVKDGNLCLMLDMDDIHDLGLAKYDFLGLKTVKVIDDTCKYLGLSYPKSHEVDWNDEEVWKSLAKDGTCIFQFESPFAANSIRRFKPKNLFEMCLVTACIRPSGASYRDDLFARKVHHNPSAIIDDLLKNNLGYLVYQEDIIAFLQQICGLNGSDADNVRRGIARKKTEILDKAMPQILEGYCNKSDKPRDEAEKEAQEFLQIIEDASSYMFGYNHSIAYCMLSYLCAYYRYHHPIEFLTAFLNNAANQDDINNGTKLALSYGIRVTTPKYGVSKSEYFYDSERRIIAKGTSSIKSIGAELGDELYRFSQKHHYDFFVDLLCDAFPVTKLNSGKLDALIKIDYFTDFGNQRELMAVVEFFEKFKRGTSKELPVDEVDGTELEPLIIPYASKKKKDGSDGQRYKLFDVRAILRGCEKKIKSLGLDDLDLKIKLQNSVEYYGYVGYVTGDPKDRQKLYVTGVRPARRRNDNVLFGYNVSFQSIGSGKQNTMTVFTPRYKQDPIREHDIIVCLDWERSGQYYNMLNYKHIY